MLADINTPNDDRCFGITPYPISIILKGSVLLSSSFTWKTKLPTTPSSGSDDITLENISAEDADAKNSCGTLLPVSPPNAEPDSIANTILPVVSPTSISPSSLVLKTILGEGSPL